MFASKAWVAQRGVASKEERDSYWDDAPPVWQVLTCCLLFATTMSIDTEVNLATSRFFDRGFFVSCIPSIASSALNWGCPTIRSPSFPVLQRAEQLSESAAEQDICTLVLSIDVRMDQAFLDERPATGQAQPMSAFDGPTGDSGVSALEGQSGVNFTLPSAGHGTDSNNPLSVAKPRPRMPKEMMGEMLRVKDYVER